MSWVRDVLASADVVGASEHNSKNKWIGVQLPTFEDYYYADYSGYGGYDGHAAAWQPWQSWEWWQLDPRACNVINHPLVIPS